MVPKRLESLESSLPLWQYSWTRPRRCRCSLLYFEFLLPQYGCVPKKRTFPGACDGLGARPAGQHHLQAVLGEASPTADTGVGGETAVPSGLGKRHSGRGKIVSFRSRLCCLLPVCPVLFLAETNREVGVFFPLPGDFLWVVHGYGANGPGSPFSQRRGLGRRVCVSHGAGDFLFFQV